MNLKYKSVDEKDIKFLYQLFIERLKYPKKIRFKKEEIPSFVEHKKFVRNHLIGKGYQSWHIIIYNNRHVGAICLKKDGEWGYHILMKYWKKGIGQIALQWLIEQNPDKILIARIKSGNDIAKHIAEKFGHELVSHVYVRIPNQIKKPNDKLREEHRK